MNLSRNQKRYASVLGACVLALVADRLFLAPGEAEADEPTGGPGAPVLIATPTRRDPLPTASIPEKPLAERFEALAEEHAIDLAALIDPAKVPWDPPPGPGLPPPVLDTVHPEVNEFRRAHRLNAVMAIENGGYAIVDGRRLRIGEEIDGFMLVEIRRRSILFESRGFARVELKLLDAVTPGGSEPSIRRPQ